MILYSSRGGVFDEEISTSKPFLEHSTIFLCIITWFTHTPNIEVLCSIKGSDVEISSSNTPPREMYGIILSESNDET